MEPAPPPPRGRTTTTLELAPSLFVDEPPRFEARFALIVESQGASEAVMLDPDVPVVVGRDFPSDFVVGDPGVSRQHARFAVVDGGVAVTDLDSRNGTFVRGRRVNESRVLPGDIVNLGAAKLRVAYAAPTRDTAERKAVVEDPSMVELYNMIDRVAGVDAPVLILGETGTGKEHVAKRLHERSPRQNGPLVAVNCAAIPGTLVESTLFGHEKGAFTGAIETRQGVFERAKGGVLFLDEIGELPLDVQPALLRVLEAKKVTRVGSTREIEFDARIVAATHCDLPAMVEEGSFREDLFYRLETLTLVVPPLRERRTEIEPMAQRFLEEACTHWDVGRKTLGPSALRALQRYCWPGNVRQLRNVVQRAALLCKGGVIGEEDLPAVLAASASNSASAGQPIAATDLRRRLREFESQALRDALERTGGNRSAAARLLRLPTASLFRRLKVLGIAE
jgi:two-component system, NtrC family, response regulator AtoC